MPTIFKILLFAIVIAVFSAFLTKPGEQQAVNMMAGKMAGIDEVQAFNYHGALAGIEVYVTEDRIIYRVVYNRISGRIAGYAIFSKIWIS